MSEWQIRSSSDIDGLIQLGMPLAEVKQAFGNEFDTFRRTRDATNEVLAFDSRGVHVVIDAENHKAAGIIVFPPNNVWIAGVQVLQEQASSVRMALQEKGVAFERDDAGLWSPQLDVWLVTVDGVIDGVQIGASG